MNTNQTNVFIAPNEKIKYEESTPIFNESQVNFALKGLSIILGPGASFSCDEQFLATTAILSSDADILIIMPTGKGKSLLILFAAIVETKISIVIVPLKALFHDLIKKYGKFNIDFEIYNRDLCVTKSSTRIILVQIENVDSYFHKFIQELHVKALIQRIVIDEVHMILTQESFRGSFKYLYNFRRAAVPLVLLTATLPTCRVYELSTFLASEFKTIRMSTDRENAQLNVVKCINMKENILTLVNSDIISSNESRGIIFCRLIDSVNDIKQWLNSNSAVFIYTGVMNEEQRLNAFNRWFETPKAIMVATPAFSHGIDYPSVRLIIHCNPSYSLIDYQQEIGRGGRDNKPYNCTMLVETNFVDKLDDELNNDNDIKNFVLNTITCRRAQLTLKIDGNAKHCLAKKDRQLCDVCNKNTTMKIINNNQTSVANNGDPGINLLPIDIEYNDGILILNSVLEFENANDVFAIGRSVDQGNFARVTKLFTENKVLDSITFMKSSCAICSLYSYDQVQHTQSCPKITQRCFTCFDHHSSKSCLVRKKFPVGMCYYCGFPKSIGDIELHCFGSFGSKCHLDIRDQVWNICFYLYRFEKRILEAAIADISPNILLKDMNAVEFSNWLIKIENGNLLNMCRLFVWCFLNQFKLINS